jgi:predicted metal-dependent peptidase
MHLKLEPSDKFPVGATDGQTLYYNPEWVGSQPEPFVRTFVAHETEHCTLGHSWRRGDREQKEWNIATDLVINIGLRDAGFPLPDGCYVDEQFRGWTAEAVYAYRRNQRQLQQEQQGQSGNPSPAGDQGNQPGLPQGSTKNSATEAPQQPQTTDQEVTPSQDETIAPSPPTDAGTGGLPALPGTDGKPCPTGQVLDAPKGADSEESGMDPTDWQVASEQALRVAKKAGKLPGNVEAMMESQVRATATDWAAHLREFFQKLNPTNYSWTRPSRRIQPGTILPGTVKDKLGTIVWVGDISGSISSSFFTAMANELGTVLAEVQPKEAHFVQVDAAVQSAEEFFPGDEVTLHRRGFGGTRFRPAFEWVEQEDLQPAALIYLTDLECWDMPEEPDYPVLWVTPEWVTKDGPFGRTIQIRV